MRPSSFWIFCEVADNINIELILTINEAQTFVTLLQHSFDIEMPNNKLSS